MYTLKIEQAIRAAAVLHDGQYRKGPHPFPYVTHCISVGMLLIDYTADESVIVAGILHDTLEDTDYTYEELCNDFGQEVADLVLSVTHITKQDEKKRHSTTWEQKMFLYTTKIKENGTKTALIAASDKIHNMRSMIEAYIGNEAQFMVDFGKNFQERITFFEVIRESISEKVPEKLLKEYDMVFEQFKSFVKDVEKICVKPGN